MKGGSGSGAWMSWARMRPSASFSATVSTSCTAVTRAAMMPTASSTDIIGPPKAKQSSDSCAMLFLRFRRRRAPAGLRPESRNRCIIAATAAMSSRWATGSAVSTAASVAMPGDRGIAGEQAAACRWPARCTSILRCGSGLEALDDDEIDRRQSCEQFRQAAARARRAARASGPSGWPRTPAPRSRRTAGAPRNPCRARRHRNCDGHA